jgi:transposase-like protein
VYTSCTPPSPIAKKSKRERLEEPNVPAVQQGGSVSKYDKFTHVKVAEAMAKNGSTQAEIAEAFDISTRTFLYWLGRYPELRQALEAGNQVFDTRVERALAERAIGDFVSWEDEEINPVTGEIKELRKHKHYPPDPGAATRWLLNRRPHDWREVQKIQVETVRKSSQELLEELHNKLLELKADGYLTDLPLKQLPAPESDYE